jgi:hypothetical protein
MWGLRLRRDLQQKLRLGAVASALVWMVFACGSSPESAQGPASMKPASSASPATAQTAAASPSPSPPPSPSPSPKASVAAAPVAAPPPPPQPPPPAPKDTCGAPANPWGYNFCSGNLIYSPPANFCQYFSCIKSFWTYTSGYVDQCNDGMYSHSGGRQGACSQHGGEKRPLYAP